MLGSYVCLQCRTRLLRRVTPVRNSQWHPRATFLSLRSQKPQVDTEAEAAEAGAPSQGQQHKAREEDQNSFKIHYTTVGGPKNIQSAGRYSRHVRHDTNNRTQQQPLKHPHTAGSAESEHGVNYEDSDVGRSYAKPIDEALSASRIDKAWKLFEDTYTSKDCKALTEPSLSDVAFQKNDKTFSRLLNAVTGAFCRGATDLTVTPTEALFRYEQLGIARPEYWARQTLTSLTYQAIQAVNGSTNKPQRDLPSLLSELLSVWRLFFQCKGPKGGPLETISTEWQLPAIESLPGMYESKDFNMRLQEFHPKYVGNPALGFCAVYLYSIAEALNSNESLHQQAAPLLEFFERVLAGSRVNSVFKYLDYWKSFSGLPVKVQNQIKMEIDAAPQKAMIMLGSKGVTLGAKDTGNATANLEEFYLKRIAHAVETRTSASIMDSIWKEVEKAYMTEGQSVAIPPRIYNAFLAGFMVLFNSQRSVDVWNHMIAHGVKPDMQSWVALLEGCVKAKDLNGFNAMWKRMLSTGTEPDNYAWTTRVNGLISLRQINLGLAALDEMGKRWLSAEQVVSNPQTHNKSQKGAKNFSQSPKTVNKCIKPSTEVINAAISALVQIPPASMRHEKRIEYVQKILGWAGNFNIKPDARTFNSLIQLYLRAGDYRTAFKVVRQMDLDGVQSDIATHTMLITAAFDNHVLDNLSESEQTDRIMALFNELETEGIKLNLYVYSTAIDRLLKQYANHSAVRAIIDHMVSRNIFPNAHVYTSLITHYFQQEPPAIRAVDSLVLQIFTSHRMPSDRIMFDRLIEGYAQHGEVGKMMSVLTRMSKHDRLPGWSALTAVVRALVEDGDMERARSVIRDVEKGEGVAKGGILGSAKGEAAFYNMVRGFGVGLEQERMGDFMRDPTARVNEDDVQTSQMHAQHEQERHEAHSPPDDVREPESASPLDEEDVHGFLTNEPEPEPVRTHTPSP